MSTASFLTILAGIVAVAAAAIYFFGIPPEMKREMEKKALKTMGENKMSYMAKDQINKIPTSDQEDVKNLRKGLGNGLGGAVNNPLGEAGGRAVENVRDFAKKAIERANTMRKEALESAEAVRREAERVVTEGKEATGRMVAEAEKRMHEGKKTGKEKKEEVKHEAKHEAHEATKSE